MSLTEFTMVEELASLVRDNLPCKHLVLSMEEAFINFLQDDTSSDGILELEPMNPYRRLLMHRLADIFGFAHESVGEGDDRHLILERRPDTSIPSILVSDILWHYDEPQSVSVSHQLLRREESQSVLKTELPSYEYSLEMRKAAYDAARERIFSVDVESVQESTKQRPKNTPVVARRMIAHALGQRISQCHQDPCISEGKQQKEQSINLSIKDDNKVYLDLSSTEHQQTCELPGQTTNSSGKEKRNGAVCNVSSTSERKNVIREATEKSPANAVVSHSRSRNGANKDNLRKEHLGAAKRMFAHALGLQPIKEGSPSKFTESK